MLPNLSNLDNPASKKAAASKFTVDDQPHDTIASIVIQSMRTDYAKREFAARTQGQLANSKAAELQQYINENVCGASKTWRRICADVSLWKQAFEQERDELITAISREDAGDENALNAAIKRTRLLLEEPLLKDRRGVTMPAFQKRLLVNERDLAAAALYGDSNLSSYTRRQMDGRYLSDVSDTSWLHLQLQILQGIKQKDFESKPRNVKEMLWKRNGLNIDRVGIDKDEPTANDYARALVQLYGAWQWLTLHMKRWPERDNDNLSHSLGNPAFGPWEVWNMNKVTDLHTPFLGYKEMNEPLGLWNVGNVKSFQSLFADLEFFNQPLHAWNVSSGLDFSEMFYNARMFNQPIGNWNVSSGLTFSNMFMSATSFDQNIEKWKVGNSTRFASMFNGAELFNQPLTDWDVSNATSFNSMFSGAKRFNQPIGGWKVRNARDFTTMFAGAEAFNQPLEKWNLSSGDYFLRMFDGAIAFQQDLSKWVISEDANTMGMFRNTTMPYNLQPA
jgi:hypothetical protein